MNKIAILMLVAVMLTACATTKVPEPTGGSRSDGVVELSYETGAFEQPQIQWDSANQSALERCEAWGYTDAEPFGGETSECQAYNAYGCIREFRTISYQCTGDK